MKNIVLLKIKDVYLLAISQVNENDECEYTCKAENSAGEKTCSANLHLIETPVGSKPQPYVYFFRYKKNHFF